MNVTISDAEASVATRLADLLHNDARLVIRAGQLTDHRASIIKVRTEGAERDFRYDISSTQLEAARSPPDPAPLGTHSCWAISTEPTQIRAALHASGTGQRIVVVGSGLTGVEAAAEAPSSTPQPRSYSCRQQRSSRATTQAAHDAASRHVGCIRVATASVLRIPTTLVRHGHPHLEAGDDALSMDIGGFRPGDRALRRFSSFK